MWTIVFQVGKQLKENIKETFSDKNWKNLSQVDKASHSLQECKVSPVFWFV